MVKKLQIDNLLEIDDLETLKALTDPTRVDILRRIGQANLAGERRTAKQLAEELDTLPTKLYYHLNLLEKHGLIQVGETQVVSGILEKHYQMTAYNITVSKNIMGSTEGITDEKLRHVLESMQAILTSTLTEIEKSLRQILKEKTSAGREFFPGQVSMHMVNEEILVTPEQARDFTEVLNKLTHQYLELSEKNIADKELGGDALYYGVTHVVAPYYHHKNPHNTTSSTTANKEESK